VVVIIIPRISRRTVQGITGGRVAALSVPVNSTEKLVTVIEVKKRGNSTVEAMHWLSGVKSDITSAISNAHGLNVGDLVLVPPGSIPPRRAARFGAPPASSSTGRTNSFGWTPEPSRWGHQNHRWWSSPGNGPCRQVETVPNRHDHAHAEQAQTGTSTARFPVWRFRDGKSAGLVVVRVSTHIAGSSYFTLPDGQILTGLLTLLVAVIFAICGRQGLRPTQLRTLAQQLLRGPSLAAAGIAGLGIALPSVDYLAAPAAIMASGTAALTQVAVLLMCNVVAFALMEIPLLAYLLAPTATVSGWRPCTTGSDRVAASTLPFVIGVGVLLDTLLGRTITVPAMATLVGRANWRSSRLSLRSSDRCHRRRPGRRSKVWFSPDA